MMNWLDYDPSDEDDFPPIAESIDEQKIPHNFHKNSLPPIVS